MSPFLVETERLTLRFSAGDSDCFFLLFDCGCFDFFLEDLPAAGAFGFADFDAFAGLALLDGFGDTKDSSLPPGAKLELKLRFWASSNCRLISGSLSALDFKSRARRSSSCLFIYISCLLYKCIRYFNYSKCLAFWQEVCYNDDIQNMTDLCDRGGRFSL